jgi:hypothetical protein
MTEWPAALSDPTNAEPIKPCDPETAMFTVTTSRQAAARSEYRILQVDKGETMPVALKGARRNDTNVSFQVSGVRFFSRTLDPRIKAVGAEGEIPWRNGWSSA